MIPRDVIAEVKKVFSSAFNVNNIAYLIGDSCISIRLQSVYHYTEERFCRDCNWSETRKKIFSGNIERQIPKINVTSINEVPNARKRKQKNGTTRYYSDLYLVVTVKEEYLV